MTTPAIRSHVAAFVVAGLCLAVAAGAQPRPIDQACVAVGCVPGDSPGFPVEITQPGAYVLTSNLDQSNSFIPWEAIVVYAEGVDIDLAGFALIGPVRCFGTPLTCSPRGGSAGVVFWNCCIASTNAKVVRLHDGSITGFDFGVLGTGDALVVERIRVAHHRIEGITAHSAGARLSNLRVSEVGEVGVSIDPAPMANNSFIHSSATSLFDSAIARVGRSAIVVDDYAQLQTNAAETDLPTGSDPIIDTGPGSRVAGLTMSSSIAPGLRAGRATSVLHSRLATSSPMLEGSKAVGYNGLVMNGGAQPEVTGSALSLGQNQCDNGPC